MDAIWLPLVALLLVIVAFAAYKIYGFVTAFVALITTQIGTISSAVQTISSDVDAIKQHF